MFSEASVSHSVHWLGGGGQTPQQTPSQQTPWRLTPVPVVTSSGGHCSGRYVSYWNAFLFNLFFNGKTNGVFNDKCEKTRP